ncbi:NUDIX domain-containing protein [Falsiroseomonas sp.]|uniref:NUDIX domain-containing protein n=1 Tax=Falsiroseomonas sp. TaxID=2870721 RepID=UPI003568B704
MSSGRAAEDRIAIEAEETLSENWHPLSKLRFAFHRRDGSTQTLEREVYRNGRGAAVLPFDPQRGTVLLTRQFRIAAHVNGDPAWLVEACAGVVEDGRSPEDTARHEAEQETGYRLRALRQVFVLYTSPGACAEKLHLFLAEYTPGDRHGSGGGLREEGEEIEVIEVIEVPLDEAWAMVRRGDILDAKTVLLLQHLLLLRGGGMRRES